MKSIISDERKCYLCGRPMNLEEHHIFGGANRKNSEKYGLKVYLCHWCHNEAPYGVHHNIKSNNTLKRVGQRTFERKYSHEDFMRIFGRNYLDGE